LRKLIINITKTASNFIAINLHMRKQLLFSLFFNFIIVATNAQVNLTVAQDGTGDYLTVQAAINAAPTGQTAPYRIFIKKGKYREKISIPSNKPFIYLIGEDVGTVTLSWDDFNGKPMPGGGTFGTSNSATVTFNAPDCGAFNITFENTTGDAPQALAINVNADRCVFKNCRFLGGQDTILTNGGGNRQYFRNCYVDGVVDFIFGGAIAVFDSCIVYAKTRLDNNTTSYITAANTPTGQNYGYVFRDCIIPANRGTTTYFLGRPWQNDGTTTPVSNTKTVFINTTMSSSVKPEGWAVWNASTNTSLVYYGEYRSRKFDSSLVDVSQRVAWSFQLNQTQAVTYSNTALFGSWNPCSTINEVCNYQIPSLAVANFRGVKGTSNATLTWNICWPNASVKHEVFRSTNRTTFSKVHEFTSSTDTTINYSFTEANPPAGTTYYYYIYTSKAGYTTLSSDTIEISSTPTIFTNGNLGAFLQGLGTPSASQSFSVSAENLTANLIITPPQDFEISNNGGSSWTSFPNTISISPNVNGSIANTAIAVRLNSTSAGSKTGVITLTSTGATTKTVSVTGNVQTTPLLVLDTLIYWPLTSNNTADASSKSPGVAATVPSLQRLTLSNGTTVSAVPAYSVLHGMAYGASTNGDGSWGTAVGGPGGNLNRAVYTQFTITANTGYTIRIDSLILNHVFHNTNSNTRLAVVYSKTNFTTADSTDVTGGLGGDGVSLPSNGFGSFANPIAITNSTAGTGVNYRLALNGATGVTLAQGETLTVRLYNSCGSTSTGRYGKIKDVYFVGLAEATVPVNIIQFNGAIQNNKVILNWETTNEINIDRYEVEKSNNGNSFESIQTITSRNSINNNSYTATDNAPFNGNNYYRLKIVEKDGTLQYSKTIVINTLKKTSLQIFPQPVVNNTFTLLHTPASNKSIIQITDITGKLLLQVKPGLNNIQTKITLNSKFKKGMYVVTYINEQEKASTILSTH
jgi:pectinesterase